MSYEIIGKPDCPQCEQAKKILTQEGIEFAYVDATVDQEAFARVIATGKRQMPAVFKDNVFIGSTAELRDDVVMNSF